ncbi:hypothetical protein L6V77_26645 [Myxococcota bacterium]|nr:hypothetical protein [Myxococcota bacterium]
MRQVINRKVFDTETATMIDEWSNGFTSSDFHYVWEGLFQTKAGAFFVAWKGGPMSEYSVKKGNEFSGSRGIKLVDRDGAYQWCEDRTRFEVIERHFADLVSAG